MASQKVKTEDNKKRIQNDDGRRNSQLIKRSHSLTYLDVDDQFTHMEDAKLTPRFSDNPSIDQQYDEASLHHTQSKQRTMPSVYPAQNGGQKQELNYDTQNTNLIRSNQTTLATMPKDLEKHIQSIDQEKANMLLIQHKQNIKQKVSNETVQQKNEKIDKQLQQQKHEPSIKLKLDSDNDRCQFAVDQEHLQAKSEDKNRKSSQTIENLKHTNVIGKNIEQQNLLEENHPLNTQQAQNKQQKQMNKAQPQPQIILTSFYPASEEDDVEEIDVIEEINKMEKEIQQKIAEEFGKPILKKKRQKEFEFLEYPNEQTSEELPEEQTEKNSNKALTQEELKKHAALRHKREAIQYQRIQELKKQLRKKNGMDNIEEETIEEKYQRLTEIYESKLQILPSKTPQFSHLNQECKCKSQNLNAMDQQRAIWLKHGIVGHLKPKQGFRYHQLFEKTEECLIDEDDPYALKGPFIPQPEDRVKFERLYQQQLRDPTSNAFKTYVEMMGGTTTQSTTTVLNPFTGQPLNQIQQPNNPFINNQQSNTLFQNSLFQNPLQNNTNSLQQNNIFKPQQNNPFLQSNQNPLLTSLQRTNTQPNNPFQNNSYNIFSSGNLNQPPKNNIFTSNSQGPSLEHIFGNSQRRNDIPQTFKQAQTPMRQKLSPFQTNTNNNQQINIPNIFQTNEPFGQKNQPYKPAYNPFQPPPLSQSRNNSVPDIFKSQSNPIPPLQNIFNPTQNTANISTNRYNTRSAMSRIR